MKTLLLLALLGVWSSPYAAPAPRTNLLACHLGGGNKVTLISESHGLDGQALFLKVNGSTEKAFQDFPDTNFVGNVALSKCVGNILVYVLNYGTPYLKGAIVRFNPDTSRIEKTNFAEKSLPAWIYVGAHGNLVIIPTQGYGETDKKYVIYRFVAGIGQNEQPEFSNNLPSAEGYRVIRIRSK